MKKNILGFFADAEDAMVLMDELERAVPLRLMRTGGYETLMEALIFDSYKSVPDFGVSVHGQSVQEPSFLLFPCDYHPRIREVRQKRGGVKFFVDQMINKKSVVLRPGGRFDASTIISGQIGTISEDPWSLRVYKKAVSIIRKNFKEVGAYFVGSQAYQCLQFGGRLTQDIRSSEEDDLVSR